jgi:hypothetical protein
MKEAGMSIKERIHQLIDQMPASKAAGVLSQIEGREEPLKSLYETASPEEWESFIKGIAIDPSIPILSEEAMSRDSIYEA